MIWFMHNDHGVHRDAFVSCLVDLVAASERMPSEKYKLSADLPRARKFIVDQP